MQNSWEFCAAYHAITLAGAVPTLLNPTYRDREVSYQLEDSGAVLLISDGPQLEGINFAALPKLRGIYTTRQHSAGNLAVSRFAAPKQRTLPNPAGPSNEILAALPYSSGTTGLPKGVMLSHLQLVANIFQLIGPDAYPLTHDDVLVCFLPLYHIYGLNVALNPILAQGGTIVLMPRFNRRAFSGTDGRRKGDLHPGRSAGVVGSSACRRSRTVAEVASLCRSSNLAPRRLRPNSPTASCRLPAFPLLRDTE